MSTRTRTLDDLLCDSTIDSRDLIARLRELEDQDDPDDAESLDEDEREELAALRDICERGESFPDWKDGTTLIRDSYFTEYAEDYADGTGALDRASWLAPYIDWERVADDLKAEHSTIEIEGETYYVRT